MAQHWQGTALHGAAAELEYLQQGDSMAPLAASAAARDQDVYMHRRAGGQSVQIVAPFEA